MDRPATGVAIATTTVALLLVPFGLGVAAPAFAAPQNTNQLNITQPFAAEDAEDSDNEQDEEHELTEAEKKAAEDAAKAAELAREAAKKAAEDAAEAQKAADEAAKKASELKTETAKDAAEKAAEEAQAAAQVATKAKQDAIAADQKRHALTDKDKHSELKRKYGGFQDISTPPLLIKPKATSSANSANSGDETGDNDDGFVSSPLDVTRHQFNGNSSWITDGTHEAAFDTRVNEPVINNIVATDYSTPADEFMAKAYFGMAVLAIGALIMAGGLLRPKRSDD